MVKFGSKRFCSYLFLFLLGPALAHGQKVSINAEKNERVTIYRRPGLDYERCLLVPAKESGCVTSGEKQDAVGWPTGSAKVSFIKDKNGKPVTHSSEGVHPFYKDYRSETWYKVHVIYETDGKPISKDGWIEQSYLDIENQPPPKPRPAVCMADRNHLKSNRKEVDQAGDLAKLKDKIQEQIIDPAEAKISKATDALYGVIGRCEITPPLKQAPPSWNKKTPVYDQVVLKGIRAQAQRLPAISAQAGVKILPEQLIEIDMLARTVYAEMGKCQHRGPQYSQMVARVIINRAEFVKNFGKAKRKIAFTNESDFFEMNHRPDETKIAAVMTTARQFNPWDQYFFHRDKKTKQKIETFNESGLSQALCPPSGPNIYWGSYLQAPGQPRVASREQEIWKEAARIATEAILFRNQFKEKTRNLSDIFLFQSKIQSHQKMSVFQKQPRVRRSVQGRPIDVDTCAVIYKGEEWQLEYLDK